MLNRSPRSIFKEEKVFVKEDHNDSTIAPEYFYTTKRFIGDIHKFTTKEAYKEVTQHERNFETRHLRAYLKGHERFQFHGNWFAVQKANLLTPLKAEDVLRYNAEHAEKQLRQIQDIVK